MTESGVSPIQNLYFLSFFFFSFSFFFNNFCLGHFFFPNSWFPVIQAGFHALPRRIRVLEKIWELEVIIVPFLNFILRSSHHMKEYLNGLNSLSPHHLKSEILINVIQNWRISVFSSNIIFTVPSVYWIPLGYFSKWSGNFILLFEW